MEFTEGKLIEMMRGAELRPSAQRLAVLSYIANERTHPTAEEIYQALTPEFPSLSLTTVYNSLHALEEAKLIRELQLDADSSHYDLAPQPRHSHFVCRRCGKIFDMPYPSGMALEPPSQGFEIEDIDVYLHGLCPECKK